MAGVSAAHSGRRAAPRLANTLHASTRPLRADANLVSPVAGCSAPPPPPPNHHHSGHVRHAAASEPLPLLRRRRHFDIPSRSEGGREWECGASRHQTPPVRSILMPPGSAASGVPIGRPIGRLHRKALARQRTTAGRWPSASRPRGTGQAAKSGLLDMRPSRPLCSKHRAHNILIHRSPFHLVSLRAGG